MMLADLLRDAHYALRQLARSRAFTAVALLTLALGIGATAAMFSVVNGVLLKPLAFPEPDALVRVYEIVPQYGRFSVAPATFLDWRARSTSFARIAALSPGSATLLGSNGPERVTNAAVSWDFFEMLRVPAALGRTFRPDDDRPGSNDVVVLSHGMWLRRFGADPAVVGRTITLNGAPVAVVGVMPPSFAFPRDCEYWVPIALDPAKASRGGHFLGVVARLKPGVATAQANTEMQQISEQLARQYPENSANESAEVLPLLQQAVGSARQPLLALLAAVVVVVLIACANVANLLLVRGSAREREMAIRVALGAGRGRLVRQMLCESVILAVVGGALGALLAYAAIPPIRTLSAGSIPRVQEVALDGTVLLVTSLVSVATGLLFGLAPAWQAARGRVAAVMNEAARGSGGRTARWMRNSLLVAEVALSVVLLVGAALLLRSFARLTQVDPGFRVDGVLAFRVSLPPVAYPQDNQRVAFFDRLLRRFEELPQLRSAGLIQSLPMRDDYVLSFEVQGRPPLPPGSGLSANYRSVSPGYFSTLGIPLKRGRAFTSRDTSATPLVAIVDEAFAARHFPAEDPIGRGIDIGNGTDGFYQIVGIVGNVSYGGLDVRPAPTMYVPYTQDVFGTMWVVAGGADAAQIASTARAAVRELDPGLPVYAVTPLSEVIADSVAQRRFSMLLLVTFAAVALFLSAVGLYGVVSYSVSQRTREIGVRVAMGATRGDVLALVVGGGMKLAAAGAAIGLAGALALARFMDAMLYGVTPHDSPSYVAPIAALLAVAAVACFVPARRALGVDPVVAIREP